MFRLCLLLPACGLLALLPQDPEPPAPPHLCTDIGCTKDFTPPFPVPAGLTFTWEWAAGIQDGECECDQHLCVVGTRIIAGKSFPANCTVGVTVTITGLPAAAPNYMVSGYTQNDPLKIECTADTPESFLVGSPFCGEYNGVSLTTYDADNPTCLGDYVDLVLFRAGCVDCETGDPHCD